MTQKYEPVEWTDETPTQPGTLINKARLDQMQSAHHFADGFEEVDAIPTEDPGTDYHKVVYCTADSTFYRWDGNEWTADIDDDTKRLLEEHEADHANPHAVTKAQVGLGNVDNTSDADKPVSTATQAAIGLVQDYLDAHEANHSNPHQVTKAQVGLGNADNTADLDKPISTAVQTALDGKVGTTGNQSISGSKTFMADANNTFLLKGETALGAEMGIGSEATGSDPLGQITFIKLPTLVTKATIESDAAGLLTLSGSTAVTIHDQRAYNTSNTSDVVTIGTLKASTDVVHLAGAETITGVKSFDYTPRGLAFISTTSGQKELFRIPANSGLSTVTCYLKGRIIDKSGGKAADFLLAFRTSQYTPALKVSAPIAMYCTVNADSSVSVWYGAQRVIAYADTLTRANAASEYAISEYVQVGTTILQSKPTEGTDYPIVVDATMMDGLVDTEYLDSYATMVRTVNAQTIAGSKTFTDAMVLATSTDNAILGFRNTDKYNTAPAANKFNVIRYLDSDNTEEGRIVFQHTTGGSKAIRNIIIGQNGVSKEMAFTVTADGTTALTSPNQRAYDPANTSDVATIATLDAYTPMVRTTGDQTIVGEKMFQYARGNINGRRMAAIGTYYAVAKCGAIANTSHYFIIAVKLRVGFDIISFEVATDAQSAITGISATSLLGRTPAGNDKIGATIIDGNIVIYFTPGSTNRFYAATFFGSTAGSGYALAVTLMNDVITVTDPHEVAI